MSLAYMKTKQNKYPKMPFFHQKSLSLIDEQPVECSSIFPKDEYNILEDQVPLNELSTKKFFPHTMNQAINMLIYGVHVQKYKNNYSNHHFVFFYILENGLDILQWFSPTKRLDQSRLDLKTVIGITDTTMQRSPKKRKFRPKYILVITYNEYKILKNFNKERTRKEMILNFSTAHTRDLFW